MKVRDRERYETANLLVVPQSNWGSICGVQNTLVPQFVSRKDWGANHTQTNFCCPPLGVPARALSSAARFVLGSILGARLTLATELGLLCVLARPRSRSADSSRGPRYELGGPASPARPREIVSGAGLLDLPEEDVLDSVRGRESVSDAV